MGSRVHDHDTRQSTGQESERATVTTQEATHGFVHFHDAFGIDPGVVVMGIPPGLVPDLLLLSLHAFLTTAPSPSSTPTPPPTPSPTSAPTPSLTPLSTLTHSLPLLALRVFALVPHGSLSLNTNYCSRFASSGSRAP